MAYDLKGKTAFITGASRGLGESIALELLKRDVYVIGVSRSPPSGAIQQYADKGMAGYKRADLSKEWKRVVQEIYDEYGGFEIFVNNAGSLSTDYLPRLDEEKISLEMKIDLEVPVQVHRLWLRLYQERYPDAKTPELSVNLCSISSLYAWPGGNPYQSTKTGLAAHVWGLRAMQKYMREIAGAEEKTVLGALAGLNTRFLAIYPDSVETGMISKAEENSLYKVRGDFLPQDIVIDAIMKSMERAGKYGEYDDIAIFANPTHPSTGETLGGAYAIFMPTDKETSRPAFHERILEKIAEPNRLISRRGE